jgi:hypothetical protein
LTRTGPPSSAGTLDDIRCSAFTRLAVRCDIEDLLGNVGLIATGIDPEAACSGFPRSYRSENRRVPAKVTRVGFAAISQSERPRLCQVSFIA